MYGMTLNETPSQPVNQLFPRYLYEMSSPLQSKPFSHGQIRPSQQQNKHFSPQRSTFETIEATPAVDVTHRGMGEMPSDKPEEPRGRPQDQESEHHPPGLHNMIPLCNWQK